MYDELLEKYFCEEITPEEREHLFAAISEDVELRKKFESIQNIYALTAWLPMEEDQPHAVTKLLTFKQKRIKHKSILCDIKNVMKYAAVACIAVFLTYSTSFFKKKTIVAAPLSVAYEEISTPPGQRTLLKMQDGTKVWLNASSTLRYPNRFAGGVRKVELSGEAYFEVVHNAEKPFIVSTGKAFVKVLGTKFNVFAYKKSNVFKVSLIEGCVKVYNKDKNGQKVISMLPYESLALVDGKFVKAEFNNTDFLLWKDGIYAFDNVPFAQIARKLELYYGVTIIQKNMKLSRYKFSGKFRQSDGIENVLKTLQKVYYFSFSRNEKNNCITIH